MTAQEHSTEELIFKAAQQVFLIRGFDGARMQEIADLAGINKALLHYYFRTKEKLFNFIFEKVISHMFPKILNILTTPGSLQVKIQVFVDTYIDFLMENPFLPMFILNELNRNYTKFTDILKEEIKNVDPLYSFSIVLEEEINNGRIRPIDSKMLFINMLSLCIFPVAVCPIIEDVIFKNDKANYNAFLISRKREVADFIWNSIKIDK